uniref:Uncharacterized protein n=1 Tax=Arundo donax TaxID=35708 RepID=A0A0A9GSM7_ARUDO
MAVSVYRQGGQKISQPGDCFGKKV